MHGLVAYEDDSHSDSEQTSQAQNDKELKIGHKSSTDSRRLQKSQIVIKRPSHLHKNHPRVPLSEDTKQSTESPPQQRQDGTGDTHPLDVPALQASTSNLVQKEPEDELSRIRALLRPPPIPGLEDWGIPPPSNEPCNPIIQTKLAQFTTLKCDLQSPKHFNDSLMSNRSFRNPHLYAKLVEFVDVNERVTNFPKHVWDPDDVEEGWFADKLSEQQKYRAEQQASLQTSGKRTQIAFASSAPSIHPSASKPQQEKDVGYAHTGHGSGHSFGVGVLGGGKRPSRYQPYGVGGQAHVYSRAREREKTRYG